VHTELVFSDNDINKYPPGLFVSTRHAAILKSVHV
jgi:hypothetical protein